MTDELQQENNRLRAANNEARALLADAAARLRTILQDEAILEGSAIEATTALDEFIRQRCPDWAKHMIRNTEGMSR